MNQIFIGCDTDYPDLHKWLSALSSKPEFKMAAHAVYRGGDSSSLKTSLTSQPLPWRHKETDKKPIVQKQASKAKEETAVSNVFNQFVSVRFVVKWSELLT